MNSTLQSSRDGAVATLTLNRPASLNALDLDMIEALVAQTTALAADPSVRCVIVNGAGKHFMAGGDIRWFASELSLSPEARQQRFAAIITRVHAVIESIHRMPQPVIASVHGAVAGFGLSLLGACDLAIAADDAYFTSAYRHIGSTPDGGSTWTLPRLVGTRKAMEMVLLAPRFNAAEALRIGLVNSIVGCDELAAATTAMAEAIASGPPLAIANAKRLINQSLGRSLSEQLAAEAASFGACAATDDFAEGIRAFLEKRPPRFESP
ncbi:MAG: enoyl-CoA hydratase-related protein [Betaproteobacteria bacterium]